MKNVTRRITPVLAAVALCFGALIPVVSSAGDGTQYKSWAECVQYCAGKCTYTGRCYLIER